MRPFECPIVKLPKLVDMHQESPLQSIGDPRFHMIITRAMKGCRVTPAIPEQETGSELSSWSSVSIVSSIDFRSPEPDLPNEFQSKLPSTSNRKPFMVLGIATAVVLLLIIVILSTVLPLTLIKNSSPNITNTTSVETSISGL